MAAAAVRIADAEGLDAVSMRRVAEAIGAAAASLYRYVDGKDDLLELMIDSVLAAAPPAATGDWRADLRALAYAVRATTMRHAWMARLSAARPSLGPHSLRWMEQSIRTVDGLPLDLDEKLAAVDTVMTFVRGNVASELVEREAAARSGLDADQWMAAQGAYGRTIIEGGAYPTLARVMIEAEGPHDPDRRERAFAFGLELILDGVAAVASRAGEPNRPRRRIPPGP
jgi:AcrR family transcriptional regulator